MLTTRGDGFRRDPMHVLLVPEEKTVRFLKYDWTLEQSPRAAIGARHERRG